MSREVDIYAACDRAIKSMDRDCLRDFGKLKLAKWDELQVIRTVKAMYRREAKKARQHYYEVAFEAYLLALGFCGVTGKKAHRMAEDVITDEWLEDILEETDFVTLYRFKTEAERKAMRLAEALEVAEDRDFEIDKALRYWTQQLAQYAINFTDYAVIQAYQDADVEYVKWVSIPDEKRCKECARLDGQVFRIDEVPSKHPRCRCRLMPAEKPKDED